LSESESEYTMRLGAKQTDTKVEWGLIGVWSMAGDPEAVRLRRRIMDVVSDTWWETDQRIYDIRGDAEFWTIHNNACTWLYVNDIREEMQCRAHVNEQDAMGICAVIECGYDWT